MPTLYCFGLGYTALGLADRLIERGWNVAGTCRSDEKAHALARRGIRAIVADRQRPPAEPDRAIAEASHLLASVPPDEAGDPVLDLWGRAIGRHGGLAWVGYLSSTAVYGDRQGGTVDETSPLEPSGERGRWRVAAERGWLALKEAHGLPVHLFRLAGIYGPGRSALDALRQGRAQRIVKPGQIFSRIHVADIATVLEASIARPNPGAAYNLADDRPAPPEDVILEAARLIGVEPPPPVPFESAELSPIARSFYADSKRVSNRRIKAELGVRLAFPDYAAGLAAIMRAGG